VNHAHTAQVGIGNVSKGNTAMNVVIHCYGFINLALMTLEQMSGCDRMKMYLLREKDD